MSTPRTNIRTSRGPLNKMIDLMLKLGRRNGTIEISAKDIELCKRIWPVLAHEKNINPAQCTALCGLVQSQKRALRQIVHHYSRDDANTFSLELEDLVNAIRKPKDLSYCDIVYGNGNEMSKAADGLQKQLLEVGASLYLTASIRVGRSSSKNQEDRIEWAEHQSIKAATQAHFKNRIIPISDSNKTNIDRKFTMIYLVQNYRYWVKWTDNINEHLQSRKNNGIMIYRHKHLLAAQIQAEEDTIVKKEILEEVLDTLNLLFPQHDKASLAFLKAENQDFYSLGLCDRKIKRSLRDYPQWGGQIERLVRKLEDEPEDLIQKFLPWRNVRRLFETVNFWLAAFVAVLTVASIALGILSAFWAKLSYDVGKESLELTRQQWLLSLAQACTDPDMAPRLPQFCSS